MSRRWWGLLVVLCIVLAAIPLSYGVSLFSQLTAAESFRVEDPGVIVLEPGRGRVVDFYGRGFHDLQVTDLAINLSRRSLISRVPLEGTFNASLIADEQLFLGSVLNGLYAIDISAPDKPVLQGEYLDGYSVSDIKRQGDILYLACGRSGLVGMRISPSGSLEASFELHTPEPVVKIALSEELLVATHTRGVSLYAVNPDGTLSKQIAIKNDEQIVDIVLHRSFLYLLTAQGEIEILSLQKEDPDAIGMIDVPLEAESICLVGDTLMVGTADRLLAYGLTEGASPNLTGTIENFAASAGMFSGDGKLFVIDSFSRLTVLSIPSLEVVRSVSLGSNIYTLAGTSEHVFAAGLESGLQVHQRSLMESNSQVRTMPTSGRSKDLLIEGRWLYVADGSGGILLKDLKRRDKPFVRFSENDGKAFYLNRERSLLFVALGTQGVEVFDVSAPGRPELRAYWPGLKALNIAGSGNSLFITKGAYGVDRIDYSNLDVIEVTPLIMNHVLDLVVAADLLYVVGKGRGLQIYRVGSDAVELLQEVKPPFPMDRFAVSAAVVVDDGIAYVANGRSGMMTVDVRDPFKAEIISLIDIPGFAKQIRVVGDRAYVLSQGAGLSVVDISDLQHPCVESHFDMPGVSHGLAVVDGRIYVTQHEAGVFSIPVPQRLTQVGIQSDTHIKLKLPAVSEPGIYDLLLNHCSGTVKLEAAVVVSEGAKN